MNKVNEKSVKIKLTLSNNYDIGMLFANFEVGKKLLSNL